MATVYHWLRAAVWHCTFRMQMFLRFHAKEHFRDVLGWAIQSKSSRLRRTNWSPRVPSAGQIATLMLKKRSLFTLVLYNYIQRNYSITNNFRPNRKKKEIEIDPNNSWSEEEQSELIWNQWSFHQGRVANCLLSSCMCCCIFLFFFYDGDSYSLKFKSNFK